MLLQLGRFQEAEQHFQIVVKTQQRPKLAALANSEFGHLLLEQQRYEQAFEAFQSTQRLWPERPSNHRNFAELWLRQGENLPEALREARLAVEKERADAGVSPETKRINLGEDLATLAWAVAVVSGDAAEVEQLMTEAIELSVASPVSSIAQVYYQCALASRAIHDEQRAEQYLQKAAAADRNGIWGRTAQKMAAGVGA